jgi:hypothetical protein
MTVENKVLLSRRGAQKYDQNPFITQAATNTKQGVKRISNKAGDRMMVVSENTGEIVGPAGFWQTQDVDKTQFVKLYVNGVKAFKDLTGAGTKVFEVLYLKVQEEIGKDIIHLIFHDINQLVTPMSESTFMRGIKELVKKGFIAESMGTGRYYLNPDYMWNGDRLAFVHEFRQIKNKPARQQTGHAPNTLDMFEEIAEKEQETKTDELPADRELKSASTELKLSDYDEGYREAMRILGEL